MASSSSISLSPPLLIPSIFKPKPRHILKFLPSPSAIYLSNTQSSRKANHFHNPCRGIYQKRTKIWRSNATSAPTESTPLETSQDIVSSTGDASIISVLFFVAFLVLSVLTIGVIYIGVTDFLQKREREKFEKEEESKKKKKKKGGKKVTARTRAGPRGFGQKIDEFEED